VRNQHIKAFVIGCVLTITCITAGATSSAPSSGFPGDPGRPLDGLPLPPGPLPPHPAPRQLPRSPPLDLVLEAAGVVVKACQDYHVAISFIDASATPKLYYIPDGTDGLHAYTAFRKAYTALVFKMSTSEVGKMTRTDKSVVAKVRGDPNLLTFAGGLLLESKGAVVGAVGVSGAEPSEKDEECALAGLHQIQSRL